MALPVNIVYGTARVAMATGNIDLLTDDVRAMLVSSEYSPAPFTDQYVTDIPADAVAIRDLVLTSPALNNNGIFRGIIPKLDSFISALTVNALVLYINTGTDSTSQLLYYSAGGPGFPFQPEGFDYVVGYDQTNGGYFQA